MEKVRNENNLYFVSNTFRPIICAIETEIIISRFFSNYSDSDMENLSSSAKYCIL